MGLFGKKKSNTSAAKPRAIGDGAIEGRVVGKPSKPAARHVVESSEDVRCSHPATVQMGSPEYCLSCGQDV